MRSRAVLPGAPSGRTTLFIGLLIGLISFLALAAIGRSRDYDRDEGFYAIAAAETARGARPWRDYFYPQGPLLPAALAPTDGNLPTMRLVAAGAGALALALVAAGIAREAGAGAAVFASLLALTSWHVATWFATTKTQPYATALTALFAWALTASGQPGRRGQLAAAAAGLLLGTATLVRLPCVGLLVPGAVWLGLATRSLKTTALKTLLIAALAAGVIAGGFAATGASRAQIAFNAVGYHKNPVESPWAQRLEVAATLASDPQVVLLLLAAFAALGGAVRSGTMADPHVAAGLIAVTLTGGYLLAQPTYPQYFAFAAPFWIWAGAPLWARLTEARIRGVALGWSLLIPWVLWVTTTRAEAVLLSPFRHQGFFSRATVAEVAAALSEFPDDAIVAAPWPGYVAMSGKRPLPGLESAHGLWAARRLEPASRRAFHVMSPDEFRAECEAGGPDAIVLNREDLTYRLGNLDALAPRYRTLFEGPDVIILAREGGSG